MKKNDRDWPLFWKYALGANWRGASGVALIPIFFFLLNMDLSGPKFWSGMLTSMRIGLQIAAFCWLMFTLVYAVLYSLGHSEILIRTKKSVRWQFALGMAFMALALGLSSWIEPSISGNHFGPNDVTAGLLLGGFTFLSALLYAGYRMTRQDNLQLRAESAEANLHVLQNQMQPHFLFNSLNSLAELIDSNTAGASVMTQKLADLYREILENSKKQVAPLCSELAIIEKYLELERLRFGDRLRYSIKPVENSDKIFLPSLVLQTLVENAVKHGITQSVEGGDIHVGVSPENSGYRVEVRNKGISGQAAQTTGTGLTNTATRLRLLYGEKADFTFSKESDEARVDFWISGDPIGV